MPGRGSTTFNAATRTAGNDASGPGLSAAGRVAGLGEGASAARVHNAYADARGEGWAVNHKKIQRLWREEGLRVPQRRRRKRLGTATAPDRPKADAPNRVWAVDFQFDATTDGRPIKFVSIIDEHTRECLSSLVDRSVTADALIDKLDRLAMLRGYPTVLRCDNGPELACEAMADWASERVTVAFIPPGEPWRNGYVESFNGRVRDECLNINILRSMTQA